MRFWPVMPTSSALAPTALATQVGHFGVVALDLHVRAQRGEGREVLEDADLDRPGLGDVVEDIGHDRAGKAREQDQRRGQTSNSLAPPRNGITHGHPRWSTRNVEFHCSAAGRTVKGRWSKRDPSLRWGDDQEVRVADSLRCRRDRLLNNGEKGPLARDTFQYAGTVLREPDPRADDQVFDRTGREDAVGRRAARDARGDMHREPAEVIAAPFAFARMQPGAQCRGRDATAPARSPWRTEWLASGR